MSPRIVALSGSPSATSKTAVVVDHIVEMLRADDLTCMHVRLSDLAPEALLHGRVDEPKVAEMARSIEAADGVIVATPIFKASFSGLLKVALDLLPQYALAGKVVLPVGTGGSPAHILALDYGLRPVLQSMGARHIVQASFIGASQIDVGPAGAVLDPETAIILNEAVLHFRHSLARADLPALLGHPRPLRAA